MHPLPHRHRNRATGAARLRAIIAAMVVTRIARLAAAAQASAARGGETEAAPAPVSDLVATAARVGDQEVARDGILARVSARADPATAAGMTGAPDHHSMPHSWMTLTTTEVVDTTTAARGSAARTTGTGAVVEWE